MVRTKGVPIVSQAPSSASRFLRLAHSNSAAMAVADDTIGLVPPLECQHVLGKLGTCRATRCLAVEPAPDHRLPTELAAVSLDELAQMRLKRAALLPPFLASPLPVRKRSMHGQYRCHAGLPLFLSSPHGPAVATALRMRDATQRCAQRRRHFSISGPASGVVSIARATATPKILPYHRCWHAA